METKKLSEHHAIKGPEEEGEYDDSISKRDEVEHAIADARQIVHAKTLQNLVEYLSPLTRYDPVTRTRKFSSCDEIRALAIGLLKYSLVADIRNTDRLFDLNQSIGKDIRTCFNWNRVMYESNSYMFVKNSHDHPEWTITTNERANYARKLALLMRASDTIPAHSKYKNYKYVISTFIQLMYKAQNIQDPLPKSVTVIQLATKHQDNSDENEKNAKLKLDFSVLSVKKENFPNAMEANFGEVYWTDIHEFVSETEEGPNEEEVIARKRERLHMKNLERLKDVDEKLLSREKKYVDLMENIKDLEREMANLRDEKNGLQTEIAAFRDILMASQMAEKALPIIEGDEADLSEMSVGEFTRACVEFVKNDKNYVQAVQAMVHCSKQSKCQRQNSNEKDSVSTTIMSMSSSSTATYTQSKEHFPNPPYQKRPRTADKEAIATTLKPPQKKRYIQKKPRTYIQTDETGDESLTRNARPPAPELQKKSCKIPKKSSTELIQSPGMREQPSEKIPDTTIASSPSQPSPLSSTITTASIQTRPAMSLRKPLRFIKK